MGINNRNDYGFTTDGSKIISPKGWKIIPEGSEIPQIHREYIENYGYTFPHLHHQWEAPRRCHSTMTPLSARLWGGARAYAVPKTVEANNGIDI